MYQVPICLVRFDEAEKKPTRSERMKAITSKMAEDITDADRKSFAKLKIVFKKAIEVYLGRTIRTIDIENDPYVPDTYALRADDMDFLVTGFKKCNTIGDVMERLEEAEFESWPPRVRRF
jgi:hypothetical protein